jgi:type I restriction enzyme, S subunit
MVDLVAPDVEEIEIDPDRIYRLVGVFSHGKGMIDRGSFAGGDTKYRSMIRVRGGQVVLSSLKAFESAIAIGPRSMGGALVSKEFPTFSPRESVAPGYLEAVVRSRRLVESLAAASTGIGARRERVGVEDFLRIPVPKPPFENQVAIAAIAAGSTRVEAVIERRNRLASAMLSAARNEIFNAMR